MGGKTYYLSDKAKSCFKIDTKLYWHKFRTVFCRYLLDFGMLHPTEKYYPLRPEFAESTFYLYQATKGLLNKKSQNCSHYI